MKKLVYIFILIAIVACESESGISCFEASGDIIETEVVIEPFTKITVWEGVQLFIKQGAIQRIIIEVPENLLEGIDLQVVDGRLNIYNKNSCTIVRDNEIAKIHITTPNITEIRSSTELPIESEGTLSFPSLELISENQGGQEGFNATGDFRLSLEVDFLVVVANGISNFYLDGTATNGQFGLFAGDCSIQAPDLKVDNLSIFHRSTSLMVVNPQESLTGTIVSIGDCIAKNRPDIVAVTTPYLGQLIFDFN